MQQGRDERGSSMIQTAVATLVIFLVLVPFILQLVVWPLSDLVGTFTAQAAVGRLREHPVDAAGAESRGREVAELFRGRLFFREVDIELRVFTDEQGDQRAEAEMRGQARTLLPVPELHLLALRSVASGPVEGFVPDREPGP